MGNAAPHGTLGPFADTAHYDDPRPGLPDGLIREGAVQVETGAGFFRAESRPARDLGVLLAGWLAQREGAEGLTVLDAMAGCGIRAARYRAEAGATALWVNDADADRLPLLRRNLAAAEPAQGCPNAASELRISCCTAQALLAGCLVRRRRFDLVDLDGFGSPAALLPLALEAVRCGGALYLTGSDARSGTGHDRAAAVRRLGAAARVHPASWELALRLQLGSVARAAWALGRGLRPLLSFSEGRTFRTAVQLLRHPQPGEERWLGMLAVCHGCGEQQVQSLLRLGPWPACACPSGGAPAAAISGPLWIGPLQDPDVLVAMAELAQRQPVSLGTAGARLLERLQGDPGLPARCWPTALLARRLGGGPPPLAALVAALRQRGHQAWASGVMVGQVRSDAPWPELLATARELAALNR